MATKIFDCIVAVSKYTDKNGQEKTKWENVGAVWPDSYNGTPYHYMMLKRIFNPAGLDTKDGSDSVKITLTKPKTWGQQGQNNSNNNNSNSQGNQNTFQATTQTQQNTASYSGFGTGFGVQDNDFNSFTEAPF